MPPPRRPQLFVRDARERCLGRRGGLGGDWSAAPPAIVGGGGVGGGGGVWGTVVGGCPS